MKSLLAMLLLVGHAKLFADTGDIEVTVKGLRSKQGFVGASLFAEKNKSGFPGSAEAAQYTYYESIGPDGEIHFVLKDVPFGTYALSFFHDEDGDRQVKMLLGIPREGFGFSNNPAIFFGPPSFGRASFKLEKEKTTVDVVMKYLL